MNSHQHQHGANRLCGGCAGGGASGGGGAGAPPAPTSDCGIKMIYDDKFFQIRLDFQFQYAPGDVKVTVMDHILVVEAKQQPRKSALPVHFKRSIHVPGHFNLDAIVCKFVDKGLNISVPVNPSSTQPKDIPIQFEN